MAKSSDYKDAIKALRAIAPNSGLPSYAPLTDEAAIRFNNAWAYGGSAWSSAGEGGGGGSWYDPLKSFGTAALNTLSVPQAAAFTTISKLLEGAGVKGEGAMEWSDALGGFSENYRGFDEILGQLGVRDSASRRAVGMGFDIVADPLWLVAPAKVARTAGQATKLPADLSNLRGLDRMTNVRRPVAPVVDRMTNVRPAATTEPVVAADRMTNTPEGIQALRDIGDIPRATGPDPATVQRVPAPTEDLFGDAADLLSPQATKTASKFQKDAMHEKYSAKYNLGVRVGLGRFKKNIDTKVRYPSRALNSMSGAWARAISMLPSEQAAHALRRSEREMSDLTERFIKDVQREKGISEQQAALMTLGAAIRNVALNIEGAKNLDDAEKLIDGLRSIRGADGNRIWTPEMDEIINQFSDRWVDWRRTNGGGFDEARPVGSYSPQMPSAATRARFNEFRTPSDSFLRSMVGNQPIADESRSFGSIFNYYTQDSFKEMLKDIGITDNVADNLTAQLDDFLRAQDEQAFFRNVAEANGATDSPYIGFRGVQKTFPDGKAYDPELNFFTIAAAKESSERSRALDNQIAELFSDLGFITLKRTPTGGRVASVNEKAVLDEGLKQAQKMYKVYLGAKRQRIVNPDDTKPITERLLKFTSLTKVAFTSPWPTHYTNNMLGDLFNSSIEGTFRDAVRNAKTDFLVAGKGVKEGQEGTYRLRAGDKYARLSNYESEAYKQTFKIGDKEYSGAQLLALSHLVGLGRGLIGENVVNLYADLNAAYRMFEATKNPFQKYWRFMQRQNIAREDAIRFRTFVRHMERGADPFEAQARTIEGIFDYGALTRFEKLALRNLLLFYTWMRLNTPFQMRGMAKKPALYNAVGDIERDRPKMPNEPDYISELGGIAVPGLGMLTFGAPWADLYRLPTIPGVGGPDSQGFTDAVRQNILSSLNPVLKVPTELATNTSFFSGGKIEKYPGELKPTKMPFLAGLLNMFEVGEPARSRKGGEMAPAVPAKLAYFLDQSGPYATNVQRFFGPPDKNVSEPLIDLPLLLAGLKRTVPNPDWERQQAVKAASRKAAETRRKNATAQNPNYSGR